jgi:ribose-phosphate pyrophosphokinase
MTAFVAWPGNETIARGLAAALECGFLEIETRRFPDAETYVRFRSDCQGQQVVVVASLDRPDEKTPGLLFLADALRAGGAVKVGLIAPYLAYLRQDVQFHPGEAVSSRTYARLLSNAFDWLVTVDPHLHRYRALSEIYTIPTHVVHAAPAIADWISKHVNDPVLIGPDSESRQWVSELATRAQAPFTVLEKTRRGDRDVEVSVPEIENWRSHVPVLFDDIISTGRTMIETIAHLRRLGLRPPVSIGVHGVFAADAFAELAKAGAGQVITCNTVPHPSNRIDVTPLLAAAARDMLDGRKPA